MEGRQAMMLQDYCTIFTDLFAIAHAYSSTMPGLLKLQMKGIILFHFMKINDSYSILQLVLYGYCVCVLMY